MFTRLAIAACLLLEFWSPAAFGVESLTLRSRSGQFLVRGIPVGGGLPSAALKSENTFLQLDPALLVVSCERIKDALLNELDLRDAWRGKVFVSLHPVQQANEPIDIACVHHPEGWAYHMEIPEVINADRLLAAIVQVLLVEIANRNAGSRQAELPPWLIDGMAAHLRATARASLMLESQTSIAQNERRQDPLRQAREKLRTRPPLTLNELNWPSEQQLSGENAELYASCAQIFVHELLRLKNGRACLREMLFRLPDHLNWQTAFLRAFQAHFPRLIDLDKWWALNVVHITGRDFTAILTREETAHQLDEILTLSVEVRQRPGDLPLHTQAKLQNVIGQWEYRRQVPVLAQKIQLLFALRLRASQDLVGLVDGYRLALQSYLQKRDKPPGNDTSKGQFSSYRVVVTEVLKRLDELDGQREVPAGQTNAPVVAKPVQSNMFPASSRPGFGRLKR